MLGEFGKKTQNNSTIHTETDPKVPENDRKGRNLRFPLSKIGRSGLGLGLGFVRVMLGEFGKKNSK